MATKVEQIAAKAVLVEQFQAAGLTADEAQVAATNIAPSVRFSESGDALGPENEPIDVYVHGLVERRNAHRAAEAEKLAKERDISRALVDRQYSEAWRRADPNGWAQAHDDYNKKRLGLK